MTPRLDAAASGLRIATEPIPGARSVAVGLWIGVGSRHETPEESGVSHFLEHMLFKGTRTRTPQQIAEAFDSLGGEVNAATGKDYTVVYVRVLDELLPRAFAIIADMLQRPALVELEQEREVVLEEIAMYDDDPQDRVHDLASQALFSGQALGRPVIGRREVVAGVTNAEVAAHHRAHYTAPNVVVAAAGGVEHQHMTGLCDELLDELPTEDERTPFEPAEPGGARLLVQEKPTEQYHVCIGGRGPSRADERRHAMGLLDVILGGSMSSRLFQEVREKRGLAYSVGSYLMGFAETGQVGVYLGTRGENLATVCEVVRLELERLAAELVTEDELRRAKDHLKGRLVLSTESSGSRMSRLGRTVLSETEVLTVEEIVERVEGVTAEELQALAAEFWRPENLSGAAIGPSGAAIEDGLRRLTPGLEAVPVAAPAPASS